METKIVSEQEKRVLLEEVADRLADIFIEQTLDRISKKKEG